MVNVFITLTARNMRPDMRIIARAEDPATEKKLKQAGANEIILPAFVGGMQIANSITHPSLDSILKDAGRHLKNDLKDLGVEIIEHPIVANGVDDRKTLQQLLRGIEARRLVLAIKKLRRLTRSAPARHPPPRRQRHRHAPRPRAGLLVRDSWRACRKFRSR